jgi:small subunit ribosomal protein S9
MTTSTTQEEQTRYYYGTGKRKSAVAQVRLYPEGGQVAINGRTLEEAIPWEPWRASALEPLRVSNMLGRFSIIAKIHGGGVSAWSGALRHGIARALVEYEPELRRTLRRYGMMTRDARVKERKKYGLKRARRAPQYTKR